MPLSPQKQAAAAAYLQAWVRRKLKLARAQLRKSAAARLKAWFRALPRRLNDCDAFTLEPRVAPPRFVLFAPQGYYLFHAPALREYVDRFCPKNPFTNALLTRKELQRLGSVSNASEHSNDDDDSFGDLDRSVAFEAAAQDFAQAIHRALDAATSDEEEEFYTQLSLVFLSAQPLHNFPAAQVAPHFERHLFQLNRLMSPRRGAAWANASRLLTLKNTLRSIADDLSLQLNYWRMHPRGHRRLQFFSPLHY